MASSEQKKKSVYRFPGLAVDLANFQVCTDDEQRSLTPRAFDVLIFLIENRGRVVEKREFFEELWKDTHVTDNALTRAIKEIRQAIGDDADSPRYIETVPKRGYRFVAEVLEAETESTLDQETSQQANIAQSSPSGPAPAPTLRRTTTIVAVSSAILLAIAFLTLVLWTTRSQPDTAEVLRTAQLTTWRGLDLFPALSPDGNSFAYCSDHTGSFEIFVRPLTPNAREIQLTSGGHQNFAPTWSPDGRFIAFNSRNRGGIWVVPSTGGTERQLSEFGSRPSWSPDGSAIAFESYVLTDLAATNVGALPPSTLWLVSADGGTPAQVTKVGTPAGGHGAASWSPDSRWLVFISYSGSTDNIWLVSRDGVELKQLTRSQSWLYDPVISPDGRHLYYGGVSQHGNFVLFRAEMSLTRKALAGEPVEIANTGLGRIKNLSISSDGKRIAYSAPSMRSNIFSVPIDSRGEMGGAPHTLTEDTSYRKGLPRFSPDGNRIAFVEFRGGTNQDIWVMDRDGQNVSQLTTDPATDWAPSWSADNDQVVFQTNRLGRPTIWSISIKTRRDVKMVETGQETGWPSISPDGKTIAFNSIESGTINVWVIPSAGGEVRQITFDQEQMGWPSWSPDGKLLAIQMKRGDDTHVAVIPSEGGEVKQITFDRGQSWPGSFSPDGDKVTFAGFRNGSWNIYWVSLSTGRQRQITNNTGLNTFVRYPSWSPRGDEIVYEYAETTGNIWLMDLK